MGCGGGAEEELSGDSCHPLKGDAVWTCLLPGTASMREDACGSYGTRAFVPSPATLRLALGSFEPPFDTEFDSDSGGK